MREEKVGNDHFEVLCCVMLLDATLCQNCHNDPSRNMESLPLVQQAPPRSKAPFLIAAVVRAHLFTPLLQSGAQPRMHVRNPILVLRFTPGQRKHIASPRPHEPGFLKSILEPKMCRQVCEGPALPVPQSVSV